MKRVVLVMITMLALAAAANAQEFHAQVTDPAFPRGRGPRVLWDAGHQNEHHWWMTAFHDVLRKDGFRLNFHGTRWTRGSLADADIVVVPGPAAVHRDSLLAKGVEYYWWSDEGRQSAFTSEEVSALVEWVHAGGSLLVILDHAPHPDAARMLTEALGVEGRNSMTWDGSRRPPDYADTDNQRASKILFDREHASLGAHPILEGRNESERINRVATYVGSSVVGPLGSSPLLLLSSGSFDYWRNPTERGGREHRLSAAGRAQAVAFSLGAGRVVVVAEFTPFQASWGGIGDPDGKIGAGMAYGGAPSVRVCSVWLTALRSAAAADAQNKTSRRTAMKKNQQQFFELLTLFIVLVFASFVTGGVVVAQSPPPLGTTIVKNIRPGPDSSHPVRLTSVDGAFFFSADDGATGRELWKSDGTAEGTVLVKDINPGADDSGPAWLTVVDGTLFFAASDGITGPELWKSDGTEAGTVLVKDINPGAHGSGLAWLTDVDGIVVFRAHDGVTGPELWKSDGNEAGTVLMKDINPGAGGSALQALTVVDGTLFFGAFDGVHGVELWKTDGTEAGTLLVKDINPGPGSSGAQRLTRVGGTLFFQADDGVTGRELWKTDGTEAGTALVKDISPGARDSFPARLTWAGFFSS